LSEKFGPPTISRLRLTSRRAFPGLPITELCLVVVVIHVAIRDSRLKSGEIGRDQLPILTGSRSSIPDLDEGFRTSSSLKRRALLALELRFIFQVSRPILQSHRAIARVSHTRGLIVLVRVAGMFSLKRQSRDRAAPDEITTSRFYCLGASRRKDESDQQRTIDRPDSARSEVFPQRTDALPSALSRLGFERLKHRTIDRAMNEFHRPRPA